MSQALIAFPVRLAIATTNGLPCSKESVWLVLVCKLLETKLMQKLRFEFGEVQPEIDTAPRDPQAKLIDLEKILC